MPDRDSPDVSLLGVDKMLASIAGLPAQLPGDPRRQAVSSIHGTVYQAWWSIDAWLRLASADEVIYLEGAEDFDVVRADGAITVQVKQHTGSISLGNAKAHEALENFWALSSNEPTRHVELHYLTTSSVAMEQDASFGGLNGIEAWRAAQTNLEMAATVARYLELKLDAESALRAFMATAAPEGIQQRLIRRLHWLTNQPDLEAGKRSIDDRIAVLLDSQRRSVSLSSNVRKYLESRFWEVILEPSSARRCLTRGELLRQAEAATITYLPIAVDQLPSLLANARPGVDLLNLLIQKSPRPPEPLLRRPALTLRLEELVKQRRVSLLTGTVHKGKTTAAQLVAATLCPEAWWINLTERRLDQVDNLLLALAGRVESADCPSLIVIDDLDVSPSAHRAYRDSLALVLHRASVTGRGVILTARGASSDSAVVQDSKNVELLDVPEMSIEETETLCVEHGCPPQLVKIWGTFVNASTRGHPKLVQVRLAELVARGWPRPTSGDLTTQSSAVTSARQLARQLLSESVPASTAEFVYTASECSVPMHRSVAIRLAEGIEGLANAGDVLDNLIGKWLERIEGEGFRTTALLHGVAAEAWSPEKRQHAHIRLHDAILAKHTLDPAAAAALLFHAFIGGERRRLAYTGMLLHRIEGNEEKREVERQLLWLPYVALERGQTITDDAFAAAILRGLQFRVALRLNADGLPKICERWKEDIERIPHAEAKAASQGLMWFSIGATENAKVPIKPRFEAITGVSQLSGELQEIHAESLRRFFKEANAAGDLPPNGTTAQVMLLCANQCVRDAESLSELVQWLDNVATNDIRQEFDSMLEWPLVQAVGAFVQTAWTTKHEETVKWEPWLPLLGRLDDYAKRRASLRFGREVAKAKAIILTEYLGRSQEALEVLNEAEASFGPSAILLEQRANVLFQVQDDNEVLEIWNQLTNNSTNKTALDPFAYRRAAMSAARLKRWSKAEQIFHAAADSIKPGTFEVTKFGLKVDAALAASLGGKQTSAATLLGEAVFGLPADATNEGDVRWEAVLRALVEVCRVIENAIWKPAEAQPKFEPGYASSPDLKVSKSEPGQAARGEMVLVQILKLAATLGIDLPGLGERIESLLESRYFVVRWYAAMAQLAVAYGSGAGAGFIKALLAFDAAIGGLSRRPREQSPLAPDDGVGQDGPSAPERWFGLLAAGVCCAAQDLTSNLKIWLDESQSTLGVDAPLSCVVQVLLEGATQPADELYNSSVKASNAAPFRISTAARLLSMAQPPGRVLALQGLLASAVVSDGSYAFQELYNHHVARRFGVSWSTYAQSPFLFYSPRISVPTLLSALNDVEQGNGTLQTVLTAAAAALRQPLGEYMERVW